MKHNLPDKPYIDATKLDLERWLELIDKPQKEREYLIEDYRFPTRKHAEEYLSAINTRSEKNVKSLLRQFLIPNGGLGYDDSLLDFWIQTGKLEDVLEKYEFVKRLINLRRDTWEGNTWILDLLPNEPQLAIDTINAYITAHSLFLPDGRWDGLECAIAIIRAKYCDYIHPRDLLLDLRPRDFEYLIAALYLKMGYEVNVTQPSRDGGYDIHIFRDESGRFESSLVECKLYENNVGVKEIRALNGVVENHRANKGALVTTASFTKPARRFAERARIELIDYPILNRLMNQHLGQNWPTHVDHFVSILKRREIQSELRHTV